MVGRGGSAGVRGRLRGELPMTRTARQVDVLAAFVAGGGSVSAAAALVVVPVHIVDKVRALVLGLGLSKLQTEGGLSCSIVRPSSPRPAASSW